MVLIHFIKSSNLYFVFLSFDDDVESLSRALLFSLFGIRKSKEQHTITTTKRWLLFSY